MDRNFQPIRPNFGDLCQRFLEVLNQVMQTPGDRLFGAIRHFTERATHNDVDLATSTRILMDLIMRIQTINDVRISKALTIIVLNILERRKIEFEEPVVVLTRHLAKIYQNERNWEKAAALLAALPINYPDRPESVDSSLETYLKIVRLYLTAKNIDMASFFVLKASVLQSLTKNETLQIFYRFCYCRLLDFHKKFGKAAEKYYELSHDPCMEDERTKCLNLAMVCTYLASIGQSRSRMLAILSRDKRCPSLKSYSVLKEMTSERIIRLSELDSTEGLLELHQQGESPGGHGWTILERAIIEHNIDVASKFYSNITFIGLGGLLDITPAQAEMVAGQMISEGTLSGCIDQIDSIVLFQSGEVLTNREKEVESLCYRIERVIAKIIESEPAWVAIVNEKINIDGSLIRQHV